MEIFKGRPAAIDGRLMKEISVYDLLDSLEIQYERVDHEHADTMEVCSEIEKVLNINVCKNLFLCNRQKTNYYLLMMPGYKPFKTKELSSQINSARLSFASSEDMQKYLDIQPGSVSIMGLMNDKAHKVQLLVDEDVLKEAYVGCHPCINTSSLKLKTEDVFYKFLDAVQHKMIIVHLEGKN